MKKSLLILVLVFSSSLVMAQEKTLISGEIEHGGFGGPRYKLTQINGETVYISGGRGGWIINHMFVIGGGGYSLQSDIDVTLGTLSGGVKTEQKLDFNYSGFEFEYIGKSDNTIHYTIYTLLGGGNVSCGETDRVFVFEPAVNGELNVIKWFRINVGISYRLVTGLDISGLDESDLSGIGASITLKFGIF
ncbi:hypothetical protein ACFL4V_01830 [Candidatus Latescibacterota bacterium]